VASRPSQWARTGAGRSKVRVGALAIVVAVATGTAVVGPAVETAAGAATIPPPNGAGPPVAASGMGTQAALSNPRCRHDDPKYGPYGRFDSAEVGGGPVCVKAWKSGGDNGGATTQGVTGDRITVVAVVPNDEQLARDPVRPRHLGDNSPSDYENAIYDAVLPAMRFDETWGRDLQLTFVRSSGNDESAQRADLVTVKAMKPFAVINLVNNPDLDVLETGLAADKIMTFGYATTTEEATRQAPYRWGQNDKDATAINSAEVVGKQLVGRKAGFAGDDDVKGATRKFGVVYQDRTIDYDQFRTAFRNYGGTVASTGTVPSNVPDDVQSVAPTIISRLKAAGVTTVMTFADFTVLRILMEAASKQEWHPEWFITGAQVQDIGILMRGFPTDESAHAFGISSLPPYVQPDTEYANQVNPLNWYWGLNAATNAQRLTGPLTWLLTGIHTAGPDLTPKTFTQGLYANPPVGGALADRADISLTAYGKAPKLPYNAYASLGLDFAPYWWDPETTGPSNGLGTVGKGVGWYVDGGKRYVATTWPKKPFAWFDKKTSIDAFAKSPVPPLGYAGDCNECPAKSGTGDANAPSQSGVIFAAGGTGASAA
jgi:hypothetical protein